MSTQHYSKFDLNTYKGTAYFQAHLPPDYPLEEILQKCRTHRRLPLRLQELSAKARQWCLKTFHEDIEDIERLYDADGYELDPDTGKRLTDAEVDADWARWNIPDIKVEDIPLPAGGFADPDTWKEPLPPPDLDALDERLTKKQLLADIKERGREYTARYYGIPVEHLPPEPVLAIDSRGQQHKNIGHAPPPIPADPLPDSD